MPSKFPNLPIKNNLLRHLVWVGIVKIILLYAIWYAFFRGNHVDVDAQRAADQILSTQTITN